MLTLLQRLLPLALSCAAGVFAAGCTGTAGFDFIEVHGTLGDGTAVDGHKPANTALVPSLEPSVGTVVAVGAPYSGPEDLGGFRLEWIPSAIAAGASFPSDPNGPVIFYVARNLPDAGTSTDQASAVSGGTITFTAVGSKITGTLANLVLTRDGQTTLTVTSGSFQATSP